MSESEVQPRKYEIKRQAAWALVGVLVYLVLPSLLTPDRRPAGHFVSLAHSFVQGSLTIRDDRDNRLRTDELIPANPKEVAPIEFYCPYPPMPAVLLMPFVWLFGTAVRVETACRVVSIVNVLIFDASLRRLSQKLGMAPMSSAVRIALTALFGFGTAVWHSSFMGMDWHLAHAVALMFMLLALREFSDQNRPMLIGLFIGAALLARPTAAMSGLFFAMVQVLTREKREANEIGQRVRGLIHLTIPVLGSLACLLVYNQFRFGSIFDFGYRQMLLKGEGAWLMEKYGQFAPAFIPWNFFWFFLAPWWIQIRDGALLLTYDPRGASLFLVSPVFAYSIFAALRGSQGSVRSAKLFVYSSFTAIACTLLPLLMYFNTGYFQFGHRFSIDYLVPLMLLVVVEVSARPGRIAYVLIVLSILVQATGLYYSTVQRLPISINNWL